MASAILLILGTASGLFLCAMLVWSIYRPGRRVWPVTRLSATNQLLVWGPTVVIFSTTIMLGLLHWNSLAWPGLVRYGLGGGLVVIGNVIVWIGVFGIGAQATSGAADTLRTSGLYKWSRNPQYVADMMILAGLGILTATLWTLPVIMAGIAALILAPFAEEPWMRGLYGAEYDAYCETTRRFV